MNRQTHLRTGWLVSVLCLACTPLWAQDDAGANRERGIEEVLVTAQKRTQRNVDVGINVSALSGNTMKSVRIEQVRDISVYIPNMNVKEQVPGAIPVVTIRGVGLEDFSSTNSPAAGVYVDEVSLSSLALMSFDLYDMARIEVLKGPQGTLYGRNSTAGALNLVTARPGEEWEAYLKLGTGNYSTREAEAMVNVPLLERLALRVAGKYIRQKEGFWTSSFAADEEPGDSGLPGAARIPGVTDGLEGEHQGNSRRNLGERDIRTVRLRLALAISESMDADYKIERLRQRSELGQPEFFGMSCSQGSEPHDPENCTDLNGYTDTRRDPYHGDWTGEFPYHIDQTGQTLTFNADFGWATLTSVTGHIDFERLFHIDVDATPRDSLNFVQADAVTQLSEELRLSGDLFLPEWLWELPVGWLAGVFWSRDDVEIHTPGRHQELIPQALFPIPGINELTSQIRADQETTSKAAFVNFDWHLGDNLTLITGLRYTWEERRYVGGTEWSLEIPGTLESTYTDDEITDSNRSWRLGLNYSPSDDSLLYATASKGTKSGGFFSGVTTAQRQLEPYDPEELKAYELGFKLQGIVTLNASAFYYDYKDVQTFMRSPSSPSQFIGNVPEARIYGADLDLLWLPLEGLTVQAGLGVLETELGAFIGPSGDDIPKGNEMPNAPAKTANLLLRYELPLWRTGLVTGWQADAHYTDNTYKEATNDPLIAAGSYSVVNARISLFPEERQWELAFWGKNLSDELYVVQGINVGAFFLGNRNYSAPRTYGAEVVYHFF